MEIINLHPFEINDFGENEMFHNNRKELISNEFYLIKLYKGMYIYKIRIHIEVSGSPGQNLDPASTVGRPKTARRKKGLSIVLLLSSSTLLCNKIPIEVFTTKIVTTTLNKKNSKL